MPKPNWNLDRAKEVMDDIHPNEVFNMGGHCQNPKCNYEFTSEDETDCERSGGWIECPNCGFSQNLMATWYDTRDNGGYTRAGISMDAMGTLGETIVARQGALEGVGEVTQTYTQKNYPIDAIIGPYGVEIKTNHAESQPRFKIGGEWVYVPSLKRNMPPRQGKLIYCEQNGLYPAICGVRLNFYSNQADIFFRPGMTDTWIGNSELKHLKTVSFQDLNPFRTPELVPQPAYLPDDDETPPEKAS